MVDATGRQKVNVENPVRLKLLGLWTAADASNPNRLKLYGIWSTASIPNKYAGNSVIQQYLSVWDVTAINPVSLNLLGFLAVPSAVSDLALGKFAHSDGVRFWPYYPAEPEPLDPCSYGICPDPIAMPGLRP